MDDMTIIAVGRQMIELSIQREQLYRQVLQLQQEKAALEDKIVKATTPKPQVTGVFDENDKVIPIAELPVKVPRAPRR